MFNQTIWKSDVTDEIHGVLHAADRCTFVLFAIYRYIQFILVRGDPCSYVQHNRQLVLFIAALGNLSNQNCHRMLRYIKE